MLGVSVGALTNLCVHHLSVKLDCAYVLIVKLFCACVLIVNFCSFNSSVVWCVPVGAQDDTHWVNTFLSMCRFFQFYHYFSFTRSRTFIASKSDSMLLMSCS